MKRGFSYGFLLLLVVPGMAQAAELDCAVASTAREHLVCEDKTLSATAEHLNQAYAAALAVLSPKGGRTLRESQLAWLRYVDALCPMMTDPAQRTQAVSCVSPAYTERIRDLQTAAVQKGPFLFSRVDNYSASVLSPRLGSYDPSLASHHIAYLRIDEPATRQTALWNALVVRKDQPSACGDGEGDTRTSYSLGLVTANLISITWTVWDYCHGTPHGFGETNAQTLVLSPEPHPLTPSDLFRSDSSWTNVSQPCCSRACGSPRETSN